MIEFEQIAKANATIKTTDIKGKEYAEVNQRIKAFRMVFPSGGISTEIIQLDNGVVTMRATVFDENGNVLGTGTAQEKETSSYINKTSFIENCETSAVGRALGMCGFGIDTSVASAEEVTNAINNQNQQTPTPTCSKCGAVIKAIKRGDEIIPAENVAENLGGLCTKCYREAQKE
jgi:hypothetical protein